MKFDEDWFCQESQDALADLARQTDDVPGAIVEVGCWQGRSTLALANAVAPEWVYAVDTWQGSAGEISSDLAAERDVFAEFLENIRELGQGNIAPMKMDWREWFSRNRQQIRFLHIDAEHSFDEVYDNIKAALPWMSPGSIICGDDATHPPVRDAVLRFFPDAQVKATLWWHRIGDG